MTQEQLAERSGVGVRTIRRLETSQPTDPRIGTVTLLADALGVTADDRRSLLAAVGSEPGEAPAPTDANATPTEPPPGRPAVSGPLAEAAEQLARAVRSRWQREEEQRRIHDPFPLPVRWQPMPARLTDHWDNIQRVPPSVTAAPLDLTGTLADIADIYRRIPSGRLVVLGRAGSGKTILTLRFVLDYLDTRADTDPVPVIFSLGSWNPTVTPLRDWIIGQLLRDYPGLVAKAPGGSTLAAALVETGRVLPLLDGFDEIAEGLHRSALEALNGTSLPLLLTSRPDEYARAVAASDVLTWAAGVELTGLTPADLDGYLPRTTRRAADGDNPGTAWNPVLVELRDRPDSPAAANLAEVLSTPLMVVLARTVYSDSPGQAPSVLLDTDRFPTAAALEDHLLSSFVPTVYSRQPPQLPAGGRSRPHRNWEPHRAQHWLGYLAQHLDRLDTPNLAWWQLGNSLRRSTRILAVVLACALVSAALDWLVYVPRNLVRDWSWFSVGIGLMDGLLVGPAVGLAFGLVYGLLVVYGEDVFEPSRVRIQLLGRNRRVGGRLVHSPRARFGAGMVGGFVVGIGYYPAVAVLRGLLYGFPPTVEAAVQTTLVNMVLHGLIFGLAAGGVFALAAALETPLDISSAASPVSMLATNRATVVRQVLLLVPMLTLAIAFGGELVVALFQGHLGRLEWGVVNGLIIGSIGGLSGVAAYVCAFTAWGQWAVLARVWLPLTGKVPWALIEFLDDAYHRGVLRQTGAVYQFRHARLQEHLSRDFRARHTDLVPIGPGRRKGEAG
jgi:transcriptional regulator with XRE-family HTH domain